MHRCIFFAGMLTGGIAAVTVSMAPALEKGVAEYRVDGPTVVASHSVESYSATLEFEDGGSQDVTDEAVWTIEPEEYGAFFSAGQLTLFDLDAEDSPTITVRASFAGMEAGRVLGIVDRGEVDVIEPTLAITDPAGHSTFTLRENTVTLKGTVQDNVGIVAVFWENHRGGDGPCAGVTSWTTGAIPLHGDLNVITITAGDAAGNQGMVRAMVTYIPEDLPTNPPPENDNGGDNDNIMSTHENIPDDPGTNGTIDDAPPVISSNDNVMDNSEPIQNLNGNVDAPPSSELPPETGGSSGGRRAASSCGAFGAITFAWSLVGLTLLRRRMHR